MSKLKVVMNYINGLSSELKLLKDAMLTKLYD